MVAGQRLLQGLEQPVGRARVHGVGVVDDDHPRRRLVRPRAGRGARIARMSSMTICPPGPDGPKRRHVGVQARLDPAANLAGAAAEAGRDRAVERHGQPERRAALAHPSRTLEHVGVCHAAAADRPLASAARASPGR